MTTKDDPMPIHVKLGPKAEADVATLAEQCFLTPSQMIGAMVVMAFQRELVEGLRYGSINGKQLHPAEINGEPVHPADATFEEVQSPKVLRTIDTLLDDDMLEQYVKDSISAISPGILAALRERERQQRGDIGEGFTIEHDDQHTGEELAMAAAVYAMPHGQGRDAIQGFWPWAIGWFKPGVTNQQGGRVARLRELEKAMALLAAEYDREVRLMLQKD